MTDFDRTRKKQYIKRFPDKNPPGKKKVEIIELEESHTERLKVRLNARISSKLCATCEPTNERTELQEFYGNECFYCFNEFEDVDHFIPLSRGGKHCWSNIVPSCKSCNHSKADKMPWDWSGWDGQVPDLTACERRGL